MHVFRAFASRLLDLFAKGRRDRDLADELDAHLQAHIDDDLRAGMTREMARQRALIALGGMESMNKLLVVTVAACYIPARRAMRVNPMAALRSE